MLLKALKADNGSKADELSKKVAAFRKKYASVLVRLTVLSSGTRWKNCRNVNSNYRVSPCRDGTSRNDLKRCLRSQKSRGSVHKIGADFLWLEKKVGVYKPTPDHESEQRQSYKVDPKVKWDKPLWEKGAIVVAIPHATIPPNTPMLLWEKNVLISPSGGRYRLDYYPAKFLKTVKHGLPKGEWETEAGVFMVPKDVEFLEGLGLLKAGLSEKSEKARVAGDACSEKTWKSAEAKFAKIQNANITRSTRENRTQSLRKKMTKKVTKKCKKHFKKFSKAFAVPVKARAEQRKECLKSVKASLQQ